MTCAAIIVAGGSGSRAGGDIPKQYRLLGGKPLLHHTIQAFSAHPGIAQIVLVIDPSHRDRLGDLPKDIQIVAGGQSRTASVRAGLARLSTSPPDTVLIHDAARPFASHALISGVIDALQRAEAAIPALPVTDALVRQDGEGAAVPIDRQHLHRVQTPQGFHFAKLWHAYQSLADDAALPDDAAVAAKAGMTQVLTQGDEENFKVTFADDFSRAESRLNPGKRSVTGSGFDVHRLEPGTFMMLCGVRVEAGLSLVGHSDADVALHAVTDAVLGASSAGDIGDHFPPTNPQWRGADSGAFLRHAVSLCTDAGGQIIHADLTLICERPKVGPHKAAMRARLSDLLGLPIEAVNIKATTTEGLGFTGRGEGVAAQALVTVIR